ncbi:hypothetical protein K3A88_13435, partial [Streptomyces geysiriensis]|nr:hypothetical protein [Streptomyces geysiriensis]
MRVAHATVQAVNGLTARWAAAADGGTVFSAVGVWPLLALLADGAAGAARRIWSCSTFSVRSREVMPL